MPAQTRNADPAGKIPFRNPCWRRWPGHPERGTYSHSTIPAIWVKGPRKGPAANRNPSRAQSQGDVAHLHRRRHRARTHLRLKATTPWPKQALTRSSKGALPAQINATPFYRMPENLQGGLFTSGNIAFEKETFEQLGGFDEDLVVMEDLEIGHRIRTRGHPPHVLCRGERTPPGPEIRIGPPL